MGSGFKMKGYTYPGKSPMKGAKAKAKRAAAATKADDAIIKMQDELGEDFKSSNILSSPTRKFEINWSDIATDAIGAVTEAGVQAGIGALSKGKKKKTKGNAPAPTMGGQQFGSGSKIT